MSIRIAFSILFAFAFMCLARPAARADNKAELEKAWTKKWGDVRHKGVYYRGLLVPKGAKVDGSARASQMLTDTVQSAWAYAARPGGPVPHATEYECVVVKVTVGLEQVTDQSLMYELDHVFLKGTVGLGGLGMKEIGRRSCARPR